ncbi:LeoA/HP0731 family dynamin-like GTPase [Pectobacterium brasiliense]|uniref:LeoA/HP0731 family dynamin-like GTPase n=1 Tax=Pectobacterium brasiliense TaxID=180957 RepID=UPI00301619CD
MEKTLNAFKQQQALLVSVLEKLRTFLQEGEEVGVPVDPVLKLKLEHAINDAGNDKLKIALIGGFSEGKTSIAAAWLEQLDKSSMNISHQESSNEVKIYYVGDDVELIDTPGLFGFKEQLNDHTHTIEKYKEITKKYISEAHLILYVMDSTNPIKESHKDDLNWLFRTLDLLPRTVFVLSRFDDVADVEDEKDYQNNTHIKRSNVVSRLRDFIALTELEEVDLAVIAVAANPFDMGTEYWLENIGKFRSLSHIGLLQQATAEKIKTSGGSVALVVETQKSIIRDVLTRQLPVVVEQDEIIGEEVAKLETLSQKQQRQIDSLSRQIIAVKASLRDFVMNYFIDLILQAKGTGMETFSEFYEREIGAEGIVIETRLQNEFERQLQAVNININKMQVELDQEINHFNTTVMSLGKQGMNYVVGKNLITNKTILATRDGIVAGAKAIGLDLGKYLKFAPHGAKNLAKNVNGALAFVGVALEIWDSYKQHEREAKFREAIDKMVKDFEKQRLELRDQINSPQFDRDCFSHYAELESCLREIRENVQQGQQRRARFQQWRKDAEAIEAEFRVI